MPLLPNSSDAHHGRVRKAGEGGCPVFRWRAAEGGKFNLGVWTSGDYTDASETRSNRPSFGDVVVSQIACDIFLYVGKWGRNKGDSLEDVVRDALRSACRGNGRLVDVTFGGVEESTEGQRLAVCATVDWWDDCPETCEDAVYESLLAYLRPQYQSQVEVDVTVLSVGF